MNPYANLQFMVSAKSPGEQDLSSAISSAQITTTPGSERVEGGTEEIAGEADASMARKRVSWCWYGRLVLILALGLRLELATNASGQTAPVTIEMPFRLAPIVVTGTIAPTQLSRTSASVTVISREQIAAQEERSVTELLRQVPGLHIDQPGARASVSSVYLRGGDPNFTVVLIDGVKVNDPTNSRGGSFDFSTLSTDAIERIEIVRGPLSAVYGSDALSGAINIITRKGDPKPVRSVEVAGGRFGYVDALLQAQGMLKALDYAVSGSYLDNGEPVEDSGFESKAFYTNLGLSLSDAMQLRSVLRYADSDNKVFPDDSGGPQFAVLREVDKRDIQELTLGLTMTHEPMPWWQYRFQFGLYDHQEDVNSPGVAPGVRNPFGIPPNNTDSSFRRYELTVHHLFPVTNSLTFSLGAQAQFEDGTSIGSLTLGSSPIPTSFHLTREIWAPFLEAQVAPLPNFLLQGGVRIDLPEGFDTKVSPRAGVSYTIASTNTTLRGSWGKGFKLPSFFALSNPTVGNPNLIPETSQSVDAGVVQTLWHERLTVGATFFYNKFSDLVDFDERQNRLVNRSRVITEGVEMSLQVQPWPALGVTSHLTYLATNLQGTDEQLRNRPRWRGGFTLGWRPLAALEVNLRALFVGKVPDSSIPTGDRNLDPYARIDLAATWTITSTWQLFLTVDNLFNAHYEEFIGFPAPGIIPRGGVRARF